MTPESIEKCIEKKQIRIKGGKKSKKHRSKKKRNTRKK
jgi:hypothetical protein